MKRRSFLSTSVMGASGLALSSCSGNNVTKFSGNPATFKISELAPEPPKYRFNKNAFTDDMEADALIFIRFAEAG